MGMIVVSVVVSVGEDIPEVVVHTRRSSPVPSSDIVTSRQRIAVPGAIARIKHLQQAPVDVYTNAGEVETATAVVCFTWAVIGMCTESPDLGGSAPFDWRVVDSRT